jgi:hypothetical protein
VDEVLHELSAEVEGFTADWAEARRDHIAKLFLNGGACTTTPTS